MGNYKKIVREKIYGWGLVIFKLEEGSLLFIWESFGKLYLWWEHTITSTCIVPT